MKNIVLLSAALLFSLSLSAQFEENTVSTRPFGEQNSAFGERVVDHKGYADRKHIKTENVKTETWSQKNISTEPYIVTPNIDRTKVNRPQSGSFSNNVNYGRTAERNSGFYGGSNVSVPSIAMPGMPNTVTVGSEDDIHESDDPEVVGFEDDRRPRQKRLPDDPTSPSDPIAPLSDGIGFMLILAMVYILVRRKL